MLRDVLSLTIYGSKRETLNEFHRIANIINNAGKKPIVPPVDAEVGVCVTWG
jgi:hypothetical protein